MADIIHLHDDPHEQAERLLPWYVTGQLDPAERVQVESHLVECAECRAALPLERRLSAEVADLPLEMALGWAELRRGLNVPPPPAQRRGARMRAAVRRTVAKPGRAGWFLAAQAAMVLAVCAAVLPTDRPATYHTLGSASSAPVGNIIVIFRPDASEQDLRRTLIATGARLVDGPTSAAAYVLRVPPLQRSAALARLRAQPDVVLAQPIDPAALR